MQEVMCLARRSANTTKLEIVRIATKMILEKGYTAATPKAVCEELNISTGNLTYHFPTKEHLLAILVQMLCHFQWKAVEELTQDGESSLCAVCLELTAMATMCEESEIAKDLFIAAYTSPMCLEIIRKNDTNRAKRIFGNYCPGWTHEQYAEAEILVSGIEFATLMNTHDPVTLENRIRIALDNILRIFHVPEPLREENISKAFAIDYRAFSLTMLERFKEFVVRSNEPYLEELLSKW